MDSARSQRPRGPGLVFSAAATSLLLVLGFVSLQASQAPPPTVAEFAPAALDQIKDAPSRQSSDVGEGKGGKGSATTPPVPTPTAQPTPTATLPPIEVPRTFNCVGNPPRQIEDPQSPPCVNYWKGDNGGSTSFGVTKDEIRVAAPYGTFLTGDVSPQWQALVSFFNQKFQFYGRKIRLLPYTARGDNFAYPNPPDMIADATYVSKELKAFASLGYPDRKGAESTYYDTLTNAKVLSVIGRDPAKATEAYLAKRNPYQWTRGTAVDTQFRNYGQWVCAAWAKKPPKYGGPAWPFTPQPTVRKIGVLVNQATDGTKPDVTPMLTNLAACGEEPFVETAPESQQQDDAVNPVLQMAQNKVTTIVCVCDIGSARNYLTAAEGQGYHPEWLMGTYLNNDLDNSFAQSPPAQAQNVFGISYGDKLLPVQDSFWYAAMRFGDPSIPAPANGPIATYQQLLLLASGIQMAGPNLTPQTFADALHRTVFPNPGHGAAPYFQARVGFPNGSHAMRLDAGMYWFDQSQPGVTDPTNSGRICWVRRGVRYDYGDWPKEDPPFKQGCT